MTVSAREAVLRILGALYGDAPDARAERTFDLAAFQEDAVRRAHEVLRLRGGVLIADSVGLGKTYIALALLEEELMRGGRVLVTSPASLRTHWRVPLGRLARRHDAVSLTGHGGPASPATARHASVIWVSHSMLSRAPYADAAQEAPAAFDLVVVDEAHAFRNARTRRYRELAKLCRGARVVLLTATPVNNSLADLYAEIRLFAGDGLFRDLGVPSLRALFRAAAQNPEVSPPASLAAMVRAVTIRRTRPLLRELSVDAGSLRFPERAPAAVLRYDLDTVYPGIYNALGEALNALTFAALRPDAYARRGNPMQTAAPGELMRIVLLKRLESSAAAFAASVQAHVRFVESFLEHLRGGRLLTSAAHRMCRASSDASAMQLLLGDVALDAWPRGIDARALEHDAAADLRTLRGLTGALASAGPIRDPKLDRLRELLGTAQPKERVLVFTEFRETARYLWMALRGSGGIALIHGGGAYLGSGRSGRRAVIERFAPASNGAPPPPPRETVRTLIATDVLSEGMNLQDARHVVSYDLPWNPVRLIQRIGRIDRLGSPHPTIFPHVFLPQRGLDRILGLLARIRVKLDAIRSGVGEDGASPIDLVTAAFIDRLADGDAAVLDEVERRDAAPFEAEERLRIAYARCGRASGQHDPRTDEVVVAAWPKSGERFALLAFRTPRGLRIATVTDEGGVRIDDAAAFDALAKLLDMPESMDCVVEPDHHRIARAVTSARGRLRGGVGYDVMGRSANPDPARALARRVLTALAKVPGGADAALCERAEAILRSLSAGAPAGFEPAMTALATATTLDDAATLCDKIERQLTPHETRNPFPHPSLIAAIDFGVATPPPSVH